MIIASLIEQLANDMNGLSRSDAAVEFFGRGHNNVLRQQCRLTVDGYRLFQCDEGKGSARRIVHRLSPEVGAGIEIEFDDFVSVLLGAGRIQMNVWRRLDVHEQLDPAASSDCCIGLRELNRDVWSSHGRCLMGI